MDPLQLTLIALGLLAIGGGSLALILAVWTLRSLPAPKPPPAPPVRDPAPTLEQVPPAQPPLSSTMPPAEDDFEDDIPTSVLHADDYDDLDAMMAAVDDLPRGERR